jgi:hypothetical protein
MDFELVPAIIAGLIAGIFMETPLFLVKAIGVPVKQNIFRTWGKMLGFGEGAGRYVAGFAFHEALSAAIALGYALAFDMLGIDGSLWLWGLIGGLVHWTLAGPVVKVIPSVDPDTGEVGRQGFAYRHYGALDVVMSLGGHLTFGLSFAILYGLLRSNGGGSGVIF